jgi:hypothetical protein
MSRFILHKTGEPNLKHCFSKYCTVNNKWLHISEKETTFRQAGSGFLQILLRIQAKFSKIRTQTDVKSQNFLNFKIFSFNLHPGSKIIWTEIRFRFSSTISGSYIHCKKGYRFSRPQPGCH